MEAITQQIYDRIAFMQEEIDAMKGPLLAEISNIRHENEGIMREFERSQCSYREVVTDYQKIAEQSAIMSQFFVTTKAPEAFSSASR